ncbi:hypothetical protein BV898_02764 [Hypsibius exemplaris]|uniref:Uncharacterized protein n=1 Tax=Hypsibius exemplaris TaxID=2072580 RepID=A0A1W0X6X9_HYPEX|nr:hypothetical protein BV898_02764 [Hypsibius exemplaris]
MSASNKPRKESRNSATTALSSRTSSSVAGRNAFAEDSLDGRRDDDAVEKNILMNSMKKKGRRCREKLEDLETDQLELQLKEESSKSKITTKNAFSSPLIDLETEIVQRTEFSQTINAETSGEGLKVHATFLEACGKVYAHRVENTVRATNDLREDLQRVMDGKAIKGRKRQLDEDGDDDERRDGAGEGHSERGEDGDFYHPADEKKAKSGKLKKTRGDRKGHILADDSELECPETDTNANLISRYWTLIGNVQPGAMKDTWIDECERLEDCTSMDYVMNPDFTCLQRYDGIRRYEAPSSGHDPAKRGPKKLHADEEAVLRTAEQNFIESVAPYLYRKSSKGAQLKDCVTFPKKLEKRLGESAANAANKQPRMRPKEQATSLTSIQLERTCRQVVRDGHLVHSEDDGALLKDLQTEEDGDVELPEGGDGGGGGGDQEGEVRDSPEPDTASTTEDLDVEPASVATTMREEEGQEEETDPTTSLFTENIELDSLDQEFRMPRQPSIARSARSISRIGSIIDGTTTRQMSVDKASRYSSVMKELNEPLNDMTRSSVSGRGDGDADTTLSNGKKKSRLGGSFSDWPEELPLSEEELIGTMATLTKPTKRTTTTTPREGEDSLVEFGVNGNYCTQAMMEQLELPPSFDLANFDETLKVQTKVLLENLQKKGWLVPDKEWEDFSMEDMSNAFARAYDEDYDRNRLKRLWEEQQPQNYSLQSDDDVSDNEAGAGLEDDEEDDVSINLGDNDHPVEPTLDDKGPSPTPLSQGDRAAGELTPPVVEEPTGDGTTGSDTAGNNQDGWTDTIEPLEEKKTIGSQVSRPWNDLQASVGSGGAATRMSGEVDDDLAFAENIALKDLTGHGINIKKMKSGVQQAYQKLLLWRTRWGAKVAERAATSSTAGEVPKMPYITIQHVIDIVPAFLHRRHLVHVNPSVVFSCLLHLAYERRKKDDDDQKVYLCNSKDLKEVFLMNRDEYRAYTNCHPHLNNLSDGYAQHLLKMTIPLSKVDPLILCAGVGAAFNDMDLSDDSEDSDVDDNAPEDEK